jgi:hypothetical protein
MFSHMLALALLLAAAPPKELATKFGCSDAQPCEVVSETKAGTDASGVKLRVLQVTRGQRDECTVEEYWVVRVSKPLEAKLLLSLCNDGYGAAGVGEDTVTVKPNRLTHEQFGGSAWRWVTRREFQLSPPQLLTTTSTSFHTSAPAQADETTWSWADFRGERVRQLAPCMDDGQPDLREETTPRPVRSALIPRVSLPADYVEGGWKTASLGTCSATASWAIFGGKGTAEDAALKVVAHDKDNLLFLEITDDAWTANERKWIAGDHLEVWLASDVPSTLQDCAGKRGAEAAQWAIDVPSGTTRPGHGGRLGLPRAELVTDGKVVRMKLALAQGDWPALTLVYSDSDDGQKQERLIATSQFAFPQAATLGQLHPLAARAATCEVKEGALTGVVKTKAPAKGALFPSSGD